jgi:hypothetical protein
MVKIYTDTNVLHYFGEAFRTQAVPPEIAVELLLAPIALLELLLSMKRHHLADQLVYGNKDLNRFPRVFGEP